ncbi:MAG: hypothetical protein M1839_003152 [Geoglossum umbratile]|nr:MAG: hypothetical protein M1839_003152 [Geoglossum umbratile]
MDPLTYTVCADNLSCATFRVPCRECWGAGDVGGDLVFDVEVFQSAEVCGFGNVSINGQHLSVEGSSRTSGQDTLLVKRAGDAAEHDLAASWDFGCLYDIHNYSRRSGNEERPIAQALMFQFLTMDGTHNIGGNHGFTFSFTQSPGAELIRLDTRLWPSGAFMDNEWSDLDYLRLSTPPKRPQGLEDTPHEGVLIPASRPCPKKQGPVFGQGTQSFEEWRNGGSGDYDGRDPPPHHLSPHHRFHYRLRVVSTLVAKTLVVIFLFALCIFAIRTVARRCWASRRHSRTQRRQHRAKRRVERWSRCLARHSARRGSWWRKHFRRGGIGDEEKRAMAAPQEAILENAMQSEIRDLREAANMVSNLIAAEEGRARLPPPIRTLSLGSETSLPSYRSRASEAGDEPPPPGYDENGADDVVVDGFQYTPSATTWTPESSIVGSPKSSYSEHDDDI